MPAFNLKTLILNQQPLEKHEQTQVPRDLTLHRGILYFLSNDQPCLKSVLAWNFSIKPDIICSALCLYLFILHCTC